MWLAKPPSGRPWYKGQREEKRVTYVPVGGRRGFFSGDWLGSSEVSHIAVSAVLVTLVGLSLTGWGGPLWFMAGTAIVFLLSFLLHELAHKFAAQRYGLWAGFRIEPFGLLLTAISIVTPFKIIAPGAVVVSGNASIDLMGRVAAVGPLTNLVLVGFLFAVRTFLPAQQLALNLILGYGIYVNSIIAFFNLIPFGILDGQKILAWNKVVWGILFGVTLVLLLSSWGRLGV